MNTVGNHWPDVRAGFRDATRTDVGPRMSVRDAWRVGANDYRLGFLAGVLRRRAS